MPSTLRAGGRRAGAFAVHLVVWAVSRLPWGSLRGVGTALGWFAGSVLRIRRAHVEHAMARAGLARAHARAMYASLGASLCEFLWMAGRRETSLAGKVRFSDDAVRKLAEARAMGRGAVVASAHTGNWDLYACAAAEHFGSLVVVTKHLSVGWLDRVWQAVRTGRGVTLLGEGHAARAVLRTLRGGGTAALMIDQAPDRAAATSEVEFLGAPARSDQAPALLAARGRAPLLLVLGRRLSDGTHLVEVPLLLPPPLRTDGAFVHEATWQMQKALDAFVRAHPDQWLWLHRRWKPLPDAGRSAATLALVTPRETLS